MKNRLTLNVNKAMLRLLAPYVTVFIVVLGACFYFGLDGGTIGLGAVFAVSLLLHIYSKRS